MLAILKTILPRFILRVLMYFRYGWSGNYKNWDIAKNKCSGYDSVNILERVKESALKVKAGEAQFERDSLIFNSDEYTYPLLASILWTAASCNQTLNILDFGGSLGSSYFQNIRFLNSIKKLNWCIVEQPAYVEAGLLYFEDERLHFFKNVNECYEKYNIDVVLLSSVLQYLEYPYNYLNELVEKKPKYILIDRTPFVKKPDRITIQKVNPRFYKASYPCWFFNVDKFRNFMSINYDLIFEFDALDKAYIKSEFKGFLYKLKTFNV